MNSCFSLVSLLASESADQLPHRKHCSLFTPPASPLDMYLDMCFVVLSSGTAFHCPRDKLGCLPSDGEGIIFCTDLKSNHLPPHSIVSRQEGAHGEVLSMSCSVSLDELAKCMQEGSCCSLHSAFSVASPISEQARRTYLVTEARQNC